MKEKLNLLKKKYLSLNNALKLLGSTTVNFSHMQIVFSAEYNKCAFCAILLNQFVYKKNFQLKLHFISLA